MVLAHRASLGRTWNHAVARASSDDVERLVSEHDGIRVTHFPGRLETKGRSVLSKATIANSHRSF